MSRSYSQTYDRGGYVVSTPVRASEFNGQIVMVTMVFPLKFDPRDHEAILTAYDKAVPKFNRQRVTQTRHPFVNTGWWILFYTLLDADAERKSEAIFANLVFELDRVFGDGIPEAFRGLNLPDLD